MQSLELNEQGGCLEGLTSNDLQVRIPQAQYQEEYWRLVKERMQIEFSNPQEVEEYVARQLADPEYWIKLEYAEYLDIQEEHYCSISLKHIQQEINLLKTQRDGNHELADRTKSELDRRVLLEEAYIAILELEMAERIFKVRAEQQALGQ